MNRFHRTEPSKTITCTALATVVALFAAACSVASDEPTTEEGDNAAARSVVDPQLERAPADESPARAAAETPLGASEPLPAAVGGFGTSQDGIVGPGVPQTPPLVEPESSMNVAGGLVWGRLDASRLGTPLAALEPGSLYSDFHTAILAMGDTVIAGATTIDAAYLSSIDVLFISYPSTALAAAEQAAVQTWVAAGGRLLVLGESVNTPHIETYTSMFGVTGWVGASPATNGSRPALSTHSLVTGISDINLNVATATFSVGADAVLLADHPDGTPLFAVLDQETGFAQPGCVLVSGDANLVADNTTPANTQLSTNIINWVNTCGLVVTINEIRIDQPGADNDEYLELAGPPGTDLTGLTLLVIGDGAGASGSIENVTDLAGQTIPASGYFVMAEASYSLGSADLTTSLSFENSDNVTFLLVEGFTGSNGDDVDTDDDCVMDVTPWAYVVDEVSLVETPSTGDCYYSADTVGPDTTFVPSHTFRCPDSTGTFQVADIDINASDTPGAANGPCAVNGTACTTDAECTSGHCADGVCCDTSCGGSDPGDCQACAATLTGGSDGTCAPVAAGGVCRAATGSCDVDETCSGSAIVCPADALAAAGTACGDSTDDDCANPDTCDDSGTCLSNDESAGTSCGDSTDDECTDPDSCDGVGSCLGNDEASGTSCGDTGTDCINQDTCDGTGSCADNGFQPAATSCGDSTDDECTDPDACDGAGTCQSNHEPSGASCGDTGTDCINQDTCDGSGLCSDNGFHPAATACGDGTDDECTDPDACDGAGTCQSNHEASGVSCGDAGTDCINQDTCDGSGLCGDNGFQAAGAACGDSTNDECTDPDACDGTGGCLDNHEAAGAACGDQGVDCNVDDACDGSGVCTDNGVAAAGTACGDGTEHDCTDPDSCDAAGTCLSNDAASGTVCRTAAGDCDAEEVCDGAGGDCPADAFATAGTVCRTAAGDCDAEESCDGQSGDCPTDGSAADGTSCDDGDACTEGDACSAGTCEAGSQNVCATPPGPTSDDSVEGGGCGCRVAGQPPSQGDHAWLLLALGLPLLRRRRRADAHR